MRSTLTRGSALALLPALGMLLLAGCNDDSPESGDPSTTPSSTPSSVPTSAPSSSPSASPSRLPATTPTAPATKANPSTPYTTTDPSRDQADVTLAVTISGGKVTPSGASIKVKRGQTVLITATSDVEDELHVHGYDKEFDVEPGRTASIKFTADAKGTFEVETHDSHKLVAKLVVS